MKETTKALLESLRQTDWFACVGTIHDEPSVVVITSWPEAMRLCQSEDWDYVSLEAKNLLTSRLAARWPDRYREWNVLVREVKAVHEPLVAEKCTRTVSAYQLPQAFVHCVQWDLLMACMELEYGDCVAPAYFSGLADWYVRGHFPCGWEGPFPDGGSLCVF
jgi:hypothetical protein